MEKKKQRKVHSSASNKDTVEKEKDNTGVLFTAVNPPVSRLELAGKLGPLLLVLPLQVTDGEWDALLTVGSQTATLRRGCRAGR